jgi:nucleoporin NUP159
MFDAVYLSGNIMLNKLGQAARGLAGYHLAQRKPLEGIQHNAAQDIKPSTEWHLCEMDLVQKMTEELLEEVRKVNKQKPELEEKRKAAAKGFIKRSFLLSEFQRHTC